MLDLVWLIPAFPLVGFAVLLVAGRRLGEPNAGWVATVAMFGSFDLDDIGAEIAQDLCATRSCQNAR